LITHHCTAEVAVSSRVVHFELPADDPDRCAKFYADAFGWKVEKWGGPTDYWLVTTGEAPETGIDGGIGRRQDADDQTTNTIDVPDLDAAVAAVEAAGGTITRQKASVPGVGWLAYCLDTEGNPFGMMQADESAP
jgi:predicted enzyme related to lactoylglutathione lyase